jgi:predicted nuclease with TOPRIM domain
MAIEKRGVQQIKTIAGLVDARRSRTSAGALLELSMMEMEKQRLSKEMLRAELRCREIRARTAEIEFKQCRLQRFLSKSVGDVMTIQAPTSAEQLPIHSAPPNQFKRRQLSY